MAQTLIGSAESARRLRIHRSTFNKLVNAGEIPVAAELPGRTGARLFEADTIDRLVSLLSQEVPA